MTCEGSELQKTGHAPEVNQKSAPSSEQGPPVPDLYSASYRVLCLAQVTISQITKTCWGWNGSQITSGILSVPPDLRPKQPNSTSTSLA
jgi:hypothetical protein